MGRLDPIMLNGLHFCSALLTSGHSKWFTILHSPIHAHIHTPTTESTRQGDSQLVRSSQGEVSCSRTPQHSGNRTSNLTVLPSQPTLLPERHAAHLSHTCPRGSADVKFTKHVHLSGDASVGLGGSLFFYVGSVGQGLYAVPQGL